MRILQTAHSYAPEVNGVAEVVRQLSVRLSRRGHEVHVATKQFGRSSAEETIDGVHVHRFKVDGNAVTGMTGAVDSYVSFVSSMTWDLMSLHCAQTWTTDALLPHLEEMSSAKMFVGHGFSELLNPNYNRYFQDLAGHLSNVDAIITLSAFLEETPFCSKYGLPTPHIIPNGVDLADWNAPSIDVRKKWGIEKRQWLVSVSNHAPVKGHQTFFAVAHTVRKQRPDAVGTIIGGHYPAAKWGLGHFGIKGGCWYRCQLATKLTHGIELRRDVPRTDVISAVQEANVVLITSWREASPLVVLECMAAGTPWVAFNVGCVREHVGGVVVDTPDEMAATVLDLLENHDHRRKLKQEGRARVAQKHDWESIADQYEQIYRDVVKSKGSI